jgi:hypothetical protein
MSEVPDDTGGKQEATQFKPGQSGNPAGRPKGARSKLGEAFLEAMRASFEERGTEAIEAVINEKPDQYLKVIASLMPKQLDLDEEAAGNIARALTVAFVRPGQQSDVDAG